MKSVSFKTKAVRVPRAAGPLSGGADSAPFVALTIKTDEGIEGLKAPPEMQHVNITGRNAPEALIEFADLVTEMQVVKHPYQQGIKAQPGIEF